MIRFLFRRGLSQEPELFRREVPMQRSRTRRRESVDFNPAKRPLTNSDRQILILAAVGTKQGGHRLTQQRLMANQKKMFSVLIAGQTEQ
jgi:hypothetical protein